MRLAIITARGGSKRIVKKNIKDFLGQPMISYAINAAKNSGIFDEIMVSTDDEEIAAVAKDLGASVPFMRSAENSGDFATTADALNEVLAGYARLNRVPTEFACIYPCVPLLTAKTLKNAWSAWQKSGHIRLTPIVRFSFPIQRAFIMQNGVVSYREPKFAATRSQDLQPCYHDAGAFYFYRCDGSLDGALNAIKSNDIFGFELDRSEVQDIDTMSDWREAEMKYKILVATEIV